MEYLGHQRALRLHVGLRKLKRQLDQVFNARRVGRCDARQIWGHVGNDHIGEPPLHLIREALQDFRLAKIALQENDAFDRFHGQHIERDDAAVEFTHRRAAPGRGFG